MKTILLIGVGRFGRHIAQQLSAMGHQVMAVDRDEERVNEIMPYVTGAQIGDSTNANFLRSLGARNYDICIVAISGDFESSLITTSMLKELGARCVIARAERDLQERFLLRNGADHVIYPEKEMAKWAAMRYTCDNIHEYMELDDDHAIIEVEVPESWAGKTIGDLDLRKQFGINVLGIREGGKMGYTVLPDTVITKEMTILVIGEYRVLRRCFRL